MTRQKSVLRQIALRLPEIASFCCAALMLCVIPLYFDDAFFNINRCKVSLIRTATPWLLALMAVSLCASRLPGEKKRLERPIAPDICMAAFLLACVIACARQGFNEDVTEVGQRAKSGAVADALPLRGILHRRLGRNRRAFACSLHAAVCGNLRRTRDSQRGGH